MTRIHYTISGRGDGVTEHYAIAQAGETAQDAVTRSALRHLPRARSLALDSWTGDGLRVLRPVGDAGVITYRVEG